MLKTQIQELEPNKVALIVEVGKDQVNEAYSSFFQRAARSIKIPGFRPGKAPRNVIASHIGAEAIKSQIEEELLDKVYPQAVKEAQLEPVSPYTLEESNLQEGEPFTFKAVLEVKPKITDLAYSDYEVKVPQAIIDEESVKKVLGQLSEQLSKTQPLESGELQNNDYFLANIQASRDGQPEAELTEEKGYHKMSDETRMLVPMRGMKIGETREFRYTFDHESEKDSKFAGKTIDFHATLERISRPVVPEINDEFAKEVGDYQSLDELKAKIRADLEERARTDAEERAFDMVLGMIAEKLTVAIPEAMIQRTTDFFIQRIDRRWRQFGSNIQDFLKKSNKDLNEFRESFREKATHQTKIMLIIDAIGDREKVEVKEADYQAEIEQRAKDYNIPVEKFLASINDSAREDIRFAIRNRKIREFLLKNNRVHYDMVSEAELNKGEGQGDAGSNSN